MRRADVLIYLLMMPRPSLCYPYQLLTQARGQSAAGHLRRENVPFATTPSSSRDTFIAQSWRKTCLLAAATPSKVDHGQTGTGSEFWRARRDCWRPDVRDVEKISWGMPAKKKRTGSRGVPHRLNDDERRSFDQARRQGFLQVAGSSWRSQRRDAPLLNSYRSLMDARGRPMIVLHKLSPNSSDGADGGDRLVVDLSPLRLPEEFEQVGRQLDAMLLAKSGVESRTTETYEVDDATLLESEGHSGDDGWQTRPIYQLPPHSLSWTVTRQQGKQMGKFLGSLFDNVEEKVAASKKPIGVRPGKGRRHGGYGIG